MTEQPNIYYGTQIPKNTVDDLIRKTQEIIRIKQICKSQLPVLCNTDINLMLTENMQNITLQKNQRPVDPYETPLTKISQTDNMTPFLIKNQKSDNKVFAGRLSFDGSSIRKSSAFKSRREQYTASTSNRKNNQNFSKTHDGSFFEQVPWTQTECRKRNSRTATGGREKYIKLREQFFNESYDEQNKRTQLNERRSKQHLEQQRIHQAFLKMTYQKRLLKEQFQNAKVVEQKGVSLKKDKQTIEIVNYELNNGAVLTNKFRKPFRKTIQNIINLKYEDKSQTRVFRRLAIKQSEVQNSKRKKSEQQKQEHFHKNSLVNQAYNNGNNRQLSFIPYVTISPGVSLSESAIKATILRSRPVQETSRQKFFSATQNRTFRSYTKDYTSSKKSVESQLMTIDVCENRGSKTSLNYETKDSFRKSLLWSGKSSRNGHRIKLQNQELLKQLTD